MSSPSAFFENIHKTIVENDDLSNDFFLFLEKHEVEELHENINKDVEYILLSLEKIINTINSMPEFYSEASLNYSSYQHYFDKYKIVISYDAQDIATSSYSGKCGGVSWGSCKDIRKADDILKDVVEGGLVAYLVNPQDPYPIKSPLLE